MWYIVYREEFSSYNKGGGYFVKYLNKGEDYYSPNWFEANKYSAIGAAINRLDLDFNNKLSSYDDFLKNNLSKSYIREMKISGILEESVDKSHMFKSGRIDKIGDNGEFLGNANDEVILYMQKLIRKNSDINEKFKKKYEKMTEGMNSDYTSKDSGGDFWEGF